MLPLSSRFHTSDTDDHHWYSGRARNRDDRGNPLKPGANETRYAKQLGGLVIAMGSVSVAAFSIIIYLLRGPILQLLDAPPAVLPIIDSYWIYWLVSSWTGALLYFFYSVCRANGNTMLPGSMMIATSIINLILDPILILLSTWASMEPPLRPSWLSVWVSLSLLLR